MPMPLAASSDRRRQVGQAGQRVLEDRQQAVEEQRDQRRRLAEAEHRHGQRQHRDGRKGLADIDEAARQRQELGAERPRDDDGQADGETCWRPAAANTMRRWLSVSASRLPWL